MTKRRDKFSRLGAVGQRIGYFLHRTDMLHMQLIRDELSGLGLTPARATALAFVHENLGCRQNELGQALEINRASAMELVNSLVALGAVERREAADRRTNALFLTDRGTQLFGQFLAISHDVDEVILALLSDADRAGLVASLGLITRSLEAALNSIGAPKLRPTLVAV